MSRISDRECLSQVTSARKQGGIFLLALRHVQILLSHIPLYRYLPRTSVEGFRPFLPFFFYPVVC